MGDKIEVEEVWKNIKGYENLYQVSNLGRIKSLARYSAYRNSKRFINEKIMKLHKSYNGYLRVELCKNNITKKYLVHRLVAYAFLNEHDNNLEINHKDGNKQNNKIENLEWVSRSENEKHAYKIGLAKNTEKQRIAVSNCNKNKRIKPVIQLDKNFNFIKEWKSATEAQNELGINRKNINQCVIGKNKTAGGYVWRTKEQFDSVKYITEEEKKCEK